MRILITGAFGYLGGRLTQFLEASGEHGLMLGSRWTRGKTLAGSTSSAVVTDWDTPESLHELCDTVDTVVHVAGMNAQDCAADPSGALRANGLNTSALVHASEQTGVKRVIYISTAHVYASPLAGVLTELVCPRSLHPYATSHRAGEDAVLAATERGVLSGIVVRLSNVYGRPARPDADCWSLVVNDLCRQAVTTERLALHSSGLQRRDFLPMDEVCRALQHLIELPQDRLGFPLYNVGGEWPVTIREVTELIRDRCAEILGFRPAITAPMPGPGEETHTLEYRLDALRATGFVPAPDQKREIDRLLRYCRAQ